MALTAMWQQPGAIAMSTFRAAIRNRTLHGILLGAVALVLSSIALGQLSVENDARVIRDVGTTFVSLTMVTVAIFSGVSLLTAELSHKTIYTIVTKPVSRWMFIVGKFLGLVMTLAVVELLLGLVVLRGDPFGVVLVQSLLLSLFEGVVVAAVAVFLSSFSTPVTSGVLTFGIFVLGRLRESLYRYAELSPSAALKGLMSVVGVVIPDLTLGRADLEVAELLPLNWSYVGYVAGYDLLYSTIVILLACVIFSRRDFV